ncbi:MAG: hypothetical protein ACI8V5_003753, partial [Limisphaerales bacterium]
PVCRKTRTTEYTENTEEEIAAAAASTVGRRCPEFPSLIS